jgi:hypothetical protein
MEEHDNYDLMDACDEIEPTIYHYWSEYV